MRIRDLMPVNEPVAIGSYQFDAETIIAFASKYDPHIFHLDAEKAKDSLFGGLCASGWHVTAVAMKLNVAHHQKQATRMKAEGVEPPKLGPSPGIRDLKWLKPVFAGDTISFSLTFLSDGPGYRPDYEFCDIRFEGVNQNGETVMRFDSRVVEFV
jgi:acyl dehydratase